MEGDDAKPMTTTTTLIIQVYPPIGDDEAKRSLVEIFLESKRQSGGGDIKSMQAINADASLFKIEYEDAEAKRRVLEQEILMFSSFCIRVFDSDHPGGGYKHHAYPLNRRHILLRGLGGDNSVDFDIVRMYAENLSSDNEVDEVRRSIIFPDMVVVGYAKELDMDTLQARFQKRTKLKNLSIRLLNAYKTNSVVIMSKSSSYDQLRIKLVDELNKLKLKYFIDCTDRYLLFQFDSAFSGNVIDLIRSHIDASCMVEYCPNFELVDELAAVQSVCINEVSKYANKYVQTELTCNQIESLLNPKLNLDSSSKKNIAHIQTIPLESRLPVAPAIKPQSADKSVLVLDPQKKYTMGLLNAKQMFTLFSDMLKKAMPDVELKRNTDSNIVKAVNKKPGLKDENWKNDFLYEVGKFWSSRGAYVRLLIPNNLKDDKSQLLALKDVLFDLNKMNSAIFFELAESTSTIECYGHKNVLAAKVDELLQKYSGLREVSSSPIQQPQQQPPKQQKQSQSQQQQVLTSVFDSYLSSAKNLTQFSTNYAIINLDPSSLVYLCINDNKQILNDFL